VRLGSGSSARGRSNLWALCSPNIEQTDGLDGAKAYPRRDLHVVLDDYQPTNTTKSTPGWARIPASACTSHPPAAPWLNLVEVFFGITGQAIRRGSFASVKQLVTAIRTFSEGWNGRCHPFTWPRQPMRFSPTPPVNRDPDALIQPQTARW
jgi:hypothetical protein